MFLQDLLSILGDLREIGGFPPSPTDSCVSGPVLWESTLWVSDGVAIACPPEPEELVAVLTVALVVGYLGGRGGRALLKLALSEIGVTTIWGKKPRV